VGALEALNGMSIEFLKVLAFAVAILVGFTMYFVHRQKWQWPLLEATVTYIVVNLALVIYVLTRPLDPRWSTGKAETISAPALPQGPIVDVVTNPLGDFFGGVTGNVNAVVNASATAIDLLIWAGWALILAIVFFIFAKIKDQHDYKKLEDDVKTLKRQMAALTGGVHK
jgi:hypothetical protein